MTPQLDGFTQAYLECALWAESDHKDEQGKNYGEPLDENYSIEDIEPDSLKNAISDCQRFQKENIENIEFHSRQAGRDFWLTRNGHGTGFWDGDWRSEVGERLTKASEKFDTIDILVGDNGTLYFN